MAKQSWKKKIGYPHWNGYGNLTLLGAEHTAEHISSALSTATTQKQNQAEHTYQGEPWMIPERSVRQLNCVTGPLSL